MHVDSKDNDELFKCCKYATTLLLSRTEHYCNLCHCFLLQRTTSGVADYSNDEDAADDDDDDTTLVKHSESVVVAAAASCGKQHLESLSSKMQW